MNNAKQKHSQSIGLIISHADREGGQCTRRKKRKEKRKETRLRDYETHLEHSLKRLLERPLAQSRSLKLSPPQQIRITEDHLHRFHTLLELVLWKGVRSTDEAVGEDDVDGELNVEGPVSGVVEDEDASDGSC